MRSKRYLVSLVGYLFIALPAFAAQYTYDGAGRLTGVDWGNGKITTYAYDANGNMTKRTTETPTDADIRLIKGPANLVLTGGVDFEYELTVSNLGPQAATSVSITDTVPFGVQLLAARSSQGSCTVSGRTVNCDLGVLPADGSATVILEARHGFVGTFTNRAVASAAQFDENMNNNEDTSTTTQNTINDTDDDGMPNWWEQQHGLSAFSSSGRNGPGGNPDNGLFTNFEEWIADTNPNDPTNFFKLDLISISSPVVLQFRSSPIRLYDVEYSDDLTNDWTILEGDIEGTGRDITIIDPDSDGTKRFYRARVRIP